MKARRLSKAERLILESMPVRQDDDWEPPPLNPEDFDDPYRRKRTTKKNIDPLEEENDKNYVRLYPGMIRRKGYEMRKKHRGRWTKWVRGPSDWVGERIINRHFQYRGPKMEQPENFKRCR